MYKRQVAEIIEVEEIHDIIEQGTTMPVRCRLKNGMNVIAKYMKNPAGQQALVNEWIGSSIADVIEITIPEYGICVFSKEVIENTNFNEEIDARNAGYAFYTKEYPKTIPVITSGMLTFVKNQETEKIILFDHLVNNNDRHNGNLLCDISKGATLIAIDNSHIITEEPKRVFDISEALDVKNVLSTRIMDTNKDIYEMLCTQVGYSEDNLRQVALSIKETLTEDVLLDIRNKIPRVWYDSVGHERIDQMFDVIRKRTVMINDIAEMIIEERREL